MFYLCVKATAPGRRCFANGVAARCCSAHRRGDKCIRALGANDSLVSHENQPLAKGSRVDQTERLLSLVLPNRRRPMPNTTGKSTKSKLLFPPRHEGCGAEGDSGARGPLDAQHDPSVYASSAECPARSDRATRLWAARGQRGIESEIERAIGKAKFEALHEAPLALEPVLEPPRE